MSTTKQAMFGAGCFWGVELTFRKVEGVRDVAVGYSGGTVDNPTYEQVCRSHTGHAEVVRVEYDSEAVGYERLLQAFFDAHDPTQVNRQGPDIGDQYRSAIFTYDAEQERLAREAIRRLEESNAYGRPIATRVEPAGTFWRAEEYHQQYLIKRGMGSCHL